MKLLVFEAVQRYDAWNSSSSRQANVKMLTYVQIKYENRKKATKKVKHSLFNTTDRLLHLHHYSRLIAFLMPRRTKHCRTPTLLNSSTSQHCCQHFQNSSISHHRCLYVRFPFHDSNPSSRRRPTPPPRADDCPASLPGAAAAASWHPNQPIALRRTVAWVRGWLSGLRPKIRKSEFHITVYELCEAFENSPEHCKTLHINVLQKGCALHSQLNLEFWDAPLRWRLRLNIL